jgi:ubiquinone/menaquinone biosynthesis C-methylase UbiE
LKSGGCGDGFKQAKWSPLVRRIQVLTGDKATEGAKKRYNRIAPLYDFMTGLMEMSRYYRRELLWSKVEGVHILEVGVGTGKSFSYYPPDVVITAVDFSDRMLKRAKDKASKQKAKVRLQQMDVQNLEFKDNTFDTVVASFVFCSVPDPVRGLMEVKRVCKPGGKVVLLEHVLSANRILGWFMNLANPLVVRMIGANINRQTVENVIKSDLVVELVTSLGAGIFKLIEARKKTLSS